jgi:transposase
MAREFAGVDRGQLLLMPPSLSEWLPEDHLVWTVLGAVDQMNLDRFREAYRLGAAGRAPFDPAVMVGLLLYAYARGIRSSRAIERACWEDVAFKLITGMRCPDHSTLAEFRRRHEAEISELFDDVLALCREAGLVSVGVIAIDGTKIKASASMDQNRDYRELVGQILREAEEVDRVEDELYGSDRGDELPEALRTPEGRRQALADAKRRLAERKGRPVGEGPVAELEVDLEAVVLARPVLRRGGRRSGRGSRAASLTRTAPSRHRRSRAIARTGCSMRLIAWRRTTASSWPRTRPMTAGARVLGIPRGGC